MNEYLEQMQKSCSQLTFLKAYENRINYENEEIVIDGFCWPGEIPEMIDIIKKSGIDKFYISDSSNILINVLYAFINNGFKITKAIEMYPKNKQLKNPIIALEITL